MSFIKPNIHHKGLKKNALGLTVKDYEGVISTLCAGCGHDSATAAIQEAFFELDIPAHKVGKMSGIGCSSKTPAYFLSQSHGFNSVHGRMPSVTTGANAANRDLKYIGISGDGDSLSIGLGQLSHAIRRNLNMTYVLENNGVYGLTKGQFSAAADIGSVNKAGVANTQSPIDPVKLAIMLGAGFVARSFSGDKDQLVPLLKAAISYDGFAIIDIVSPCVTFNNHKGSTKSYEYTRDHLHEFAGVSFVPHEEEITVDYKEGETYEVTLHGGDKLVLSKLDNSHDPLNKASAIAALEESQSRGEVLTGLVYYSDKQEEMHIQNHTVDAPLNTIAFEDLCPGSSELDKLQKAFQ